MKLSVVTLLTVMFLGTVTGTLAFSHRATALPSTRAMKTCHVTNPDGASATIVATGRSVFLARGTALLLVDGRMQQGYIAVRAVVRGATVQLAIMGDDTDCVELD